MKICPLDEILSYISSNDFATRRDSRGILRYVMRSPRGQGSTGIKMKVSEGRKKGTIRRLYLCVAERARHNSPYSFKACRGQWNAPIYMPYITLFTLYHKTVRMSSEFEKLSTINFARVQKNEHQLQPNAAAFGVSRRNPQRRRR